MDAAAAPADEKTSVHAWWMLTVLTLLVILSFVDRYMLTMLVEPIKADLKFSDVEMSLILGPAFAISYAVFGIPLAWLADRYPRRWVIFGGVMLWSVAAIFTGLGRSFHTLFLARTSIGIGEASLSPAAYSLMTDSFPRKRLATAIAVYQAGVKMGQAAAFTIGAVAIGAAATVGTLSMPLLGDLKPWQLVFLLTGAPGLILASLVFTFSEPPRKQQISITGKVHGLAELAAYARPRWKLFLLTILGFSLTGIYTAAMHSWTPSYITRTFGWGPTEYGPIMAMLNAVAAVLFVFKGGIIDWLATRGVKDGALRFYTWLLLASVPFVFGAFLAHNVIAFMLMYAVLQLITLPYSYYIALTSQIIAPNQFRAQTTAFFLFFTNIVASSGPVITGFLTDHVFKDEAKVGSSLLVMGVTIPLAFVFLRMSLGPLRKVLDEMEVQAAATLPAAPPFEEEQS
ncbi:MAG: permease of the major facilitator superfamily [Caulobacter sp.]|nr:permease of the major facilitator superfamily [Caulobacter sp.]